MGGVGLGFGLIIAGFQHGFLCNFGSEESCFFGNFASGVIFFFFMPNQTCYKSEKSMSVCLQYEIKRKKRLFKIFLK